MGFKERTRKGRSANSSEGRGKGTYSTSSYGSKQPLTTATCDSCGNTCQVPFKPVSGKPVYCNGCFRKNESSSRSDHSSDYKPRRDADRFSHGSDRQPLSGDLVAINKKLDRILKLLED